MKKLILAFSLNIIVLTAFGQQNPVQNLQSTWQYINPWNCFTLSWDAPIPTATDTLIGYNVYRNDSLYTFTTNQMISCNPCIGDTSTTYCSFQSYMTSFYAHVTAVYNTSLIESAYNDSSYWSGLLATGIQEIANRTKLLIMPNPFTTTTILHADKDFTDATLTVYNSLGQQVKQVRNVSGQTITLQRGNLSGGIYFIQLTQDNRIITTDKLLVTDN
jgi:hypothetical protein